MANHKNYRDSISRIIVWTYQLHSNLCFQLCKLHVPDVLNGPFCVPDQYQSAWVHIEMWSWLWWPAMYTEWQYILKTDYFQINLKVRTFRAKVRFMNLMRQCMCSLVSLRTLMIQGAVIGNVSELASSLSSASVVWFPFKQVLRFWRLVFGPAKRLSYLSFAIFYGSIAFLSICRCRKCGYTFSRMYLKLRNSYFSCWEKNRSYGVAKLTNFKSTAKPTNSVAQRKRSGLRYERSRVQILEFPADQIFFLAKAQKKKEKRENGHTLAINNMMIILIHFLHFDV